MRREDFDLVLQKTAIIHKWLALHSQIKTDGYDRIGIIVSKRIANKAVDRNRIKRIIRETFRKHSCRETNSFIDIVVRLRYYPKNQELKDFIQSLSRMLFEVRRSKYEVDLSFPNTRLSVSD